MKHTDRPMLLKGLRYLAGALPLAAIGPIVIFSAFNNQGHPWYIPILALGLIAAAGSVFFMFKGIMTIMKALFD